MKATAERPNQLRTAPEPPLTLMAVQEKLGLFAKPVEKPAGQDHDYLLKKPLGLI